VLAEDELISIETYHPTVWIGWCSALKELPLIFRDKKAQFWYETIYIVELTFPE